MDLKGKITVFVYGTLMKGFHNEGVIDAFPHENYPATIDNMELYDVGHFPAMVKGAHSYEGELVVFDSSVDPELVYDYMDRLEGYISSNRTTSLYLREPVTVMVNGEQIETEAYLWNRSLYNLIYIDPKQYSGYKEYLYGRN